MRAQGSTLGRLRDWSPSPAWPEGRGLLLLRPLLDARRADLRAWLRGQDADWIDDPANADPRFARARARQALEGRPPDDPREARPEAHGLLAVEDDLVRLSRDADARTVAAALVCAGGGDRPPRGDRLARVLARLRRGEDFTATLAGARLEAEGAVVRIAREAGEFRRRRGASTPLPADEEAVWDGRWAITAPGPGWRVGPATGRAAALPDADRARLKAVSAPARGARPVLIRDGGGAPVLAGTEGQAHALVAERLALALDRMTHERDLASPIHGATPRNHLFSGADITE